MPKISLKNIKSIAYTISSTFTGCWLGTLYAVQVALEDSTNFESISIILDKLGNSFVAIPILLSISGTLHILHQLEIKRSIVLTDHQKQGEYRDNRIDFIAWIAFTIIGALLSSHLSSSNITPELTKQMAITAMFIISMIIAVLFVVANWWISRQPTSNPETGSIESRELRGL